MKREYLKKTTNTAGWMGEICMIVDSAAVSETDGGGKGRL
jgi:hypothetical protein